MTVVQVILKSGFYLTFCCLVQAATAQNTPTVATDTVLIEARIVGMGAGKVSLVGMMGDYNFIADTTVATADGHFIYRRREALPAGFYTFLIPGNKSFSILMDKDQHIQLRANLNDLIGTMQVEGALNTRLLYESFQFQVKQDPAAQAHIEAMRQYPPNTPEHAQAKTQYNVLMDARKTYLEGIYAKHPDAFFTKFKIAGQNPDPVDFRKPNGDLDTLRQLLDYRARFWDGIDFTDARMLRTPVMVNKLRRYIKELTPQHPDSVIRVADPLLRRLMPHKPYFQFFANWIALQYENGKTTVMDGEAVYVYIVQKFFTPELATWDTKENLEKLQRHVWEMESSLMGRKGPDVRAQDPAGAFKSIYEMTAPLVVVFMFSPDCEHCQRDAATVQRMYEKWKGKGVDFYGIAVNTKDAEWRDFVRKSGFTFTNVFDPTNRAIYAKYFVDNTPELYILNKDRIIVAKNLQAAQLEEVFERELKKLK